MMLAETLPDPSGYAGLGWLIVGLAAVIAIINQGWDFIAKVTGKDKQPLPQPLDVQVIKQMHEQFADKEEFDRFQTHVTTRHAQIFSRIDNVQKEGREALDNRLLDLNADRQRTMEKLNDQFTFIRENIAAINRELQINNHRKP